MVSDVGLPFISSFRINDSLKWQMSRAEKYALIQVLETLKPEVSIEIGTFQGGSLQVISHFSREVYSLDISKAPSKLLSSQFSNVIFKIGNSYEILNEIFEEIEKSGKKLEFILVDGDHSKNGVYKDLEAILNYPHKNKLTIIMHDSFNPQCRAGIKAIDFTSNKSVAYAELDYITGSYSPNDNFLEMWGGFALVQLNPNFQGPKVTLLESQRNLFRLAHVFSKHIIKDRLKFLIPVKRKLYSILGKKHVLDMYENFENTD
jgi:hypothetical protein